MINIHWLNTFCTLVETAHFTRTAEQLHMTQSGVSQHIKKLEEQLKTQLLLRQGKSFTLTHAGSQLHEQGRELISSLARLETDIKRDESMSGPVRLASPGSVGLKLYPYLLDLQQEKDKLTIDYRFAPNDTIVNQVAKRNVDIGLITTATNSPNLICEKIADEPLLLITPGHITKPLWSQLLELGFIGHPDAAHHTNLLFRENFVEYQHLEQFKMRGFSNQISLILEPVSRGLGFTVLPLYAANAFYNQVGIALHHLDNRVCEPLYTCTNRLLPQPARIEFIKSSIKTFLNSHNPL